MRTIVILFVVLTSVCAAQTYYWPFYHDDRMVLGGELISVVKMNDSTKYYRFTSILDRIIGLRPTDGGSPPFDGMVKNVSRDYGVYPAGITYNGIFAGLSYTTCSELFPIFPPKRDTTWLQQYSDSMTSRIWRYCTNLRVFDTTVTDIIVNGNLERSIDYTTQAFSLDIFDTADVFIKRITIGVHFWLMNQEFGSGASVPLNGFKIGVFSKNMGPYIFHFPRLCDPILQTYETSGQSGWPNNNNFNYTHTWSVADTTINDTTYYRIVNTGAPTFPLPGGSNPMRNEGDDMMVRINDVEERVLPPRYFIGDVMAGERIIRADTIDYHGKRVSLYAHYDQTGMDGYRGEYYYYTGIGLKETRSSSDLFGSSSRTRLKNIYVCPPDPLVVESPLPSLPFWQSVVYPSPARDEITIAIQHAATAAPLSGTLLITDALGRTALALPWDDISERSTLAIPIAGFAPGVYYYRLIGSEAWLAGQFVVGR